MALKIRTTGYDDYLDGSANIKMLVIGGPGAGKTRSASYWPRPFFIDCENGRGSLADRKVPYVEVRTSKDMLDALEYLKGMERIPKYERQFQTVVVDTLDSFQRLVKDEWVRDNNAASFKGWDAWGYMNSKIQLLMVRLLNLDFNVIVNVHYKDKTFTDGDGKETREIELQLQGEVKDSAFNDFGLVGWLGTYFEYDNEAAERIQKRGITFTPTPEKPFLKDRFHITGKWWPISFHENDYDQFSLAFASRADELPQAEEVGTVPDHDPTWTPKVVGPLSGGPVKATEAVEVPLAQKTKVQLLKLAKDRGLPVKDNMLKAEILAALEAPDAEPVGAEGADAAAADPAAHDATPDAPAEEAAPGSEPEADTEAESASGSPAPRTPEQLIADELGGQVIDETPEPAPEPAPEPEQPAAPKAVCARCGKDLAEENQDRVQLSWIKFREYQCNLCYSKARR